MLSKKALLNYLPLILIIVLAFLLRFVWIDKVPNAIGGDELTYVINAKAITISGTDISGTWNPLTGFIFQYPAYTLPQAELPYFLIAPFVGLMGFSLFSVRIIFVLLSVLTVLLTYLIAKALFDKNAGIAAAFIAAINPWSIYIGRTAYESTPAAFFFLLSFYMLLVLKGRRILLTIPILFLAFYSYVATKVVFIPFVLLVVFYSYFFVNKKKYLREYLIVLASCLVLFAFFTISVYTTSGPSRTHELISINDPSIVKQVNDIRKVSIKNPFTSLFENKFTIFGRIILIKLFKSFAFDYLFVFGDNFYSILRHGMFYVLDAFFLILGFASIYAQKKRTFFLLFFLSLFGVFPQLIYSVSTDNFSIHQTLTFAIFPIVIGVGIYEILNLIKNKTYFYSSLFVVGALYLFLILNFLNIYFYQFPLQGYFDFHVRVLSKYISVANDAKKDVIVYSPSTQDIFKKYLFYTNNYNKNTYLQVRKIYKSNNFKFKNVTFSGCDRTIDPSKKNAIVVYNFNCGALPFETKHIAIPRLSDGGQSYEIFNDSVCSKFHLSGYPQNISINDFAIEGQSAQKFCETFITSP